MKIQRILCILSVCFWLSAASLSASQPPPGMVRAAYFPITSLEQGAAYLEQLRLAGLNTALVANNPYQIDDLLWQAWGRLAEQQGIALFAVMNFAVPPALRNPPGQYRAYVNRRGQAYRRTPCPLDDAYWQHVIGERLEQFATLSVTTGIVGAVFDTEMYGSDVSLYTDLCVCDVCWQEFLAAPSAAQRLAAGNLAAAQRFAYLLEQDLLEAYTTRAWQRLQHIVRPMVQRVHQIQPAFQVGFLCYRYNWFYSALVQGLGTPERPVLVFSESSYVRGYTPYVNRERDQVQRPANYARYIPGVWLSRYFPRDLPSQLADLALHTDGYWLYPASSLWHDIEPKKSDPLHGDRLAYWSALQQANQELQRLDHASPGIRTIAPVRQSSFYDRTRQRLLTTPDLHAIFSDLIGRQATEASADLTGFQNLSGLSGRTEPTVSPEIYRGETLVHCQISAGGSVRLTHVPIGAETNPELVRSDGNTTAPLLYTFFNDAGDVLQTGPVQPEQPVTLAPFPVKPSGFVSLLVESGVNGAQVERLQGAVCVFEASSTFPLETYQNDQAYEFAVAPGATRLPFRAHSPRQQAAILTVRDPAQAVSQTAAITGFTEFQVAVSSPATRTFWRISAAPAPDAIFGDVRWYLYDYAYPYVVPGSYSIMQLY